MLLLLRETAFRLRNPLGGAMTETTIPPEIAALGFEEALGELERIVRQLEEGSGKLDQAIEAYERGVMLKRHCEAKLQEARMRVEKVVQSADGGVSTQPMSLD